VDNYGLTWFLSQGSGGYITGSVYLGQGCPYPFWGVGGSVSDTTGDLSLMASNPNWGDYCATYFTYTGYLSTGGCNYAAGDWYNDYGYVGGFVMTKTCEIPSSETTSSSAGSWAGGHYVFQAQMSSTSSGNLSGRNVIESDYQTGEDGCWFEGSARPKFDHVSGGGAVYLGSSNTFNDTIGWGDVSIIYYREHGKAGCHATFYQQDKIACGAEGLETYQAVKNNVLVAEIGEIHVANTRDGVLKSINYSP